MADPNASVRPPELTLVAEDRPPSLSKKPYGQDVRQAALLIALGGQADNALVQQLRATGRWPSGRTVRRWQRRLEQTGSIAPYRHTGNKRSNVLRGEDLLLLAFFRAAYPKSTHAEVIAFLWNAWGQYQQPQ